jgi:hypothetical protein
MLARFVIIALIPEPWAGDIQKLRLEHDHWSRQWLPAHITIVAPFLARMSFDLVRDIELAPLEIRGTIGGWGSFLHDRTNTIWLEAGESATREARVQLAKAVPGMTGIMTDPAIDWDVPPSHHVTVVNHVPHDVYKDLEATLRKIDIDGDFTVPHLSVFHWDRRLGRWLRTRPE